MKWEGARLRSRASPLQSMSTLQMVSTIVAEPGSLVLPVVDALSLDENRRALLRPDEDVSDAAGTRRLPRFFYEVDSWQTALNTRITENFNLWEFIGVE